MAEQEGESAKSKREAPAECPTGPHTDGDQDPTQTQPPRCGRDSYTEHILRAWVLYWALEALVKVSVTEFNTREYVTKPPTLSALQNHPEKLKAIVTTSQTETAAFHRFPRLNKTQVSNAIQSVS